MKKTLIILCLSLCFLACDCGQGSTSHESNTGELVTDSIGEAEINDRIPPANETTKESFLEQVEEESAFFYIQQIYKPDYVGEEWEPCVDDKLFYRDIPVEIALSDGRTMTLIYDEDKWLTDITIDEQPVYHFDWEYDVYTGKTHLKGLTHNGISLTYQDSWITKNPWRGETIYQPESFQIAGSDRMYLYHLTAGVDFLMDGIYADGKEIAHIGYEKNIPVMTFTEEGNILGEEVKGALLSNCRFMDGAVYIQELQAYYAPDRYFVDAKSGNHLCIQEDFEEECYIPREFDKVEEKEDEVWTVETIDSFGPVPYIRRPILLSRKLSDGRMLELLYGGDFYNRLLIQKKIDGRSVSTYRWKKNNYGAGIRVSEILTDGVKVDYLYSLKTQYKYLLYTYYGFRYNNRIFQCYYYSKDGMEHTGEEYLSIYCGNEEIVCYDSKKNVLRGKPLPVTVDVLFESVNAEPDYMYIEELGEYHKVTGL